MRLKGRIKLDKWNQVAWFIADKTQKKYKVENTEFKVEKVFVPAYSEALISKCYINGKDLSDNEICIFDTKTKSIIEIEKIKKYHHGKFNQV